MQTDQQGLQDRFLKNLDLLFAQTQSKRRLTTSRDRGQTLFGPDSHVTTM